MTEQALYTLRDIARELNLPESTVRYYRDAFNQYLPTVGAGRRRRYPPEAAATLRLIALRYHDGNTREQIERELAGLHPREIHQRPLEAERPEHGAGRPAQPPPSPLRATPEDVLAALMEGERERRQAMWQMAREIVRLGETVERQHVLLTDMAERLETLTERALPAGPTAGANVVAPDGAGAPPPPAPDTRARAAPERPVSGDLLRELEVLRQELAAERDLVERLRRSKLEMERRVAEAEERSQGPRGEVPGPRSGSVLRRFLSRDE